MKHRFWRGDDRH